MTMRPFLLALLLGTSSIAPGAHAASAEEEVIRTNSERREALANGDAAMLASILADEVMYVGASGKVETKEIMLAAVKGGFKTGPRDYQDVRVRLYGEVAVVTYLSKAKAPATGPEQRSTCVYVRRDGRWQLVSQQVTRLT